MSAPPAAVPSHRIIGMTATKSTVETQQLKYVYMIKEVCVCVKHSSSAASTVSDLGSCSKLATLKHTKLGLTARPLRAGAEYRDHLLGMARKDLKSLNAEIQLSCHHFLALKRRQAAPTAR